MEVEPRAVIARHEEMRRGVEGTYAVEGNRIIITGLFIDTAPEQGALGDGEFEIDGDILTITWLSTHQTCQTPHRVDKFRRRSSMAGARVRVETMTPTAPTSCRLRQISTRRPQAGLWIFYRSYPMMQAYVSGIVPLGETDFTFAEA